MAHRAEQIIDAGKDAVAARVGARGTHVYTHRRQTLQPTQDETPAISVDFGEDTPADFAALDGIRSSLAVQFTVKTYAPTEEEARIALLEARDEIDIVMDAANNAPAGQRLGLSFVNSIRYGGATVPDVDPEGEQFVGEIACTWIADYQMRD